MRVEKVLAAFAEEFQSLWPMQAMSTASLQTYPVMSHKHFKATLPSPLLRYWQQIFLMLSLTKIQVVSTAYHTHTYTPQTWIANSLRLICKTMLEILV